MPPPSPRPSGRGVALLSSVPAPYPSSPECLPVPARLWLCLPPPWDPAQLPSPHCVPSTDGLCVSLALVRPATACLRVSCVCLPCLGLSPSLGLCVCLIRAWSSLSNLSSLCLLDTPSPRPCLRLSLPPFPSGAAEGEHKVREPRQAQGQPCRFVWVSEGIVSSANFGVLIVLTLVY